MIQADELLISWGTLLLSVICNAGGVFLIKIKMNVLGPINSESIKSILGYFWELFKFPSVILGVIAFSIAPILFAFALSRMEISVAYPVQVVLNFLILMLLAVLFLGEAFTVNKVLAIIFAIVSIFLLQSTR